MTYDAHPSWIPIYHLSNSRSRSFHSCLDHTKLSVRFQAWNRWELCSEIDVGPPLSHTVTVADVNGWCLNWLVWSAPHTHTHTCARNCRSLPYACRYMIHMTPPLQTRTIKHLYITWVCGPYVITLLYHAHVFEWYMAKVWGEEMALNEHVSRWNLEYVLKIWIAS